MNSTQEPIARTVPTAQIATRRRWSWTWLIPTMALVVSGWIGWRAQSERGPLLEIRALEGHGIGAGDSVRYRGINVGEIVSVELEDNLSEVVMEVRLSLRAEALARAGTRFWIVRPHLALDEVTGLETIFGARYLEASPGPVSAEVQTEFLALEEPPVLLEDEEGSLEIVLVASRKFGLQPGAPINYRQVQIGRVLTVGLASDSSSIEIRANIRPRYSRLIRENTRFWEASGIDLQVGLFGGVEVGLDSMRALIVGAIALATPDEPGPAALNGHRFNLEEEAEEDWLEWRPALSVGSALLPPDAPTPRPLRAKLTWTEKQLFIKKKHQRTAWVLAVDGGLIGPADLFAPKEIEDAKSIDLQIAGRLIPFGAVRWEESELVLLESDESMGIPWPSDWIRTPTELEDVLVVGDPAAAPLPLSRARFSDEGGTWKLERGMGLQADWNGAFAFSRSDGKLIGVLFVDGRDARVVPMRIP